MESLRRLRAPQPFARHSSRDAAALRRASACRLRALRRWRRRTAPSAAMVPAMHCAEIKGRAASWISTASGRTRRQRLKPRGNRKLPSWRRRALAPIAFPQARPATASSYKALVTLPEARPAPVHVAGCSKKCANGSPQDGLAADATILLRPALLRPAARTPLPAGHDQRRIIALILVLFLHRVLHGEGREQQIAIRPYRAHLATAKRFRIAAIYLLTWGANLLQCLQISRPHLCLVFGQ